MLRGAPVLLAMLAGCQACGADPVRPDEPVAEASPASALPSSPDGCARGVAVLRQDVQRGVCVAHNYEDHGARGYGTETSRSTLREIKELGATWVSLTPYGFMRGPAATEVRHIESYPGGETDEVMGREISAARQVGLHVLLKPHIWIQGGQWIGQMDPGSDEAWESWFASYREWILRYAEMARDLQVSLLAIGVELESSTVRFADLWRALVRDIRAIYPGKLVYCANWTEVEHVTWWDDVDYIGVQFYPPLADEPDAPEAEMDRRMEGYAGAMRAISERFHRPILITEVGYKSMAGAAIHPHTWPEHLAGRPQVSTTEQARAFRAFLDGVADLPFVQGIYVWKWFTDPATHEEGPIGFSPRGKPAEAVIRAAYRGPC